MLNKRTILFFTDTFNTAVAENVSAEYAGNNEAVSVIVTKKELKSGAYNFIADKLLPEGSSIRLFALNRRIKLKNAKMDKIKSDKISSRLRKPIQRRILNALNRYNPDVVAITDQSVLRHVISAADKYEREVKVAVIPDEYILDKRFISRAVDYYFVDNFDMRNALVDNGVSDDKVVICGLPVSNACFDDCDRDSAITKFAVSKDSPTVLISASRAGDVRFMKVLEELKNASLDVNFIVACGKNRKILNYARELGYSAYNDGIDMNAALNACDAVITRPTTMLMAEAITKNKEVFALLPNGKMETATYNYLGLDLITKINGTAELIEKLRSLTDMFAEIKGEQSEEDFVVEERRAQERSAPIIAHNLFAIAELNSANRGE